jgi:hypothetical protein
MRNGISLSTLMVFKSRLIGDGDRLANRPIIERRKRETRGTFVGCASADIRYEVSRSLRFATKLPTRGAALGIVLIVLVFVLVPVLPMARRNFVVLARNDEDVSRHSARLDVRPGLAGSLRDVPTIRLVRVVPIAIPEYVVRSLRSVEHRRISGHDDEWRRFGQDRGWPEVDSDLYVGRLKGSRHRQ